MDFRRIIIWSLIGFGLVVLAGCSSECPVERGDRVRWNEHTGTVKAIGGTGSLTHNCRVGVVFDDGMRRTDMPASDGNYIYAWRLEVIND